MNFNIKAFMIGFTAALIIYIASIFIWEVGFLASILGGISTAYIAAENYKESSIYGALVGSSAALVTLIIAFFVEFVITNGRQIDLIDFVLLGAIEIVLGLF